MPTHRFLVWLLLFACPTALAAALTPFSAIYAGKYNGVAVEARRELAALGAGYRVSTSAQNLLGEWVQSEEFRLDERGAIQLDKYHSRQNVLGITKSEDMVIDPAARMIRFTRNDRRRELPLSTGDLGPISYQLQLARDLDAHRTGLHYRVVNRGKLKEYHFEPVGTEVVDTPLGAIETLKVRRVREDATRETQLWLAPTLGYLLVKLWQREEDGQSYELTLRAATIAGVALTREQIARAPAQSPPQVR